MTVGKAIALWRDLCRRDLVILLLLSTLIIACAAEKEPIEAEIQKAADDPPSVRGQYLEKIEISTEDNGEKKNNLGFIHAFVASLSVIIVSELGDKTFFIAAIMAMRHPRLTVFLGALAALALMTVLSVAFGWLATIIPRAYTYYISTALFALFGLKMLKEGYYMSPNEGQEEFEEVQLDLRKREDECVKEAVPNDVGVKVGATAQFDCNLNLCSDTPDGTEKTGGGDEQQADRRWPVTKPFEKEASTALVQDPESGVIRKAPKPGRNIFSLISRIFIQAFTLTFVAEWGDRSQLTTIILAAREDVYGVTVGGILGHGLCTGLAVMGGRMIAQKISVRTVTLIGGVVFLLFAVTALFFDPNKES